MDVDAIGQAIAARYAPANVTPPAGLTNVRKATADLPQAITAVPIVLVFPDSGELAPGNGTRLGNATWYVRFYFGVSRNVARETNACRRWLSVLLDQHRTVLALGGLVTAVRTVGWKVGLLDYGSKRYFGIELRIQVVTSEPWSASST